MYTAESMVYMVYFFYITQKLASDEQYLFLCYLVMTNNTCSTGDDRAMDEETHFFPPFASLKSRPQRTKRRGLQLPNRLPFIPERAEIVKNMLLALPGDRTSERSFAFALGAVERGPGTVHMQ